MKRQHTLLLALLLLAAILPDTAVLGAVRTVPQPASVETCGADFPLPDRLGIHGRSDELRQLATTFIAGLPAPLRSAAEFAGSKRRAQVLLEIDPALGPEAYRLDSSEGVIRITGGDTAGVWWGLQTFGQLLAGIPHGAAPRLFPAVRIDDKPRFAYRGAHLDCSRHFFTVDEVKRFLDLLALHKINRFHWHLTDDQGWRIEIRQYPELTRVGAFRAETVVGHHYHSQTYDGIPYGGFYTQEQIREIVAYAAARQIVIVPEIEMPGHAQAALASYPWLGCTGSGYQVWSRWGISKEIFCVGKEQTFEFLEKVLDEVCELFPGPYIHIGGDEAPRDRWSSCPACRRRMQECGLVREAQLQSYLIHRIEEYLAAKGRRIIGWDEILDGGVSQTAIVMSWRGTQGGVAAARQGNDVIMTPNDYFYLDYYQTEQPEANGEPLAIGGCVTLEKCYSFDPEAGLDAEARRHITGIQANTWTEYIPDYNHLQHMVLPRLAAVAEIAWSSRKSTYDEFADRLGRTMLPLYRMYGYRYAEYAFGETR